MFVAPSPVKATVPVERVKVPFTVNGVAVFVIVSVFDPLESKVWLASTEAEAILIDDPKVKVVLPLVDAIIAISPKFCLVPLLLSVID